MTKADLIKLSIVLLIATGVFIVVASTCWYFSPPESGSVSSQPPIPVQLTASGVPAVGKIVAAPPNMPFGTKLHVPGYGICEVWDRGAAITGNKLDILMPTHQEALNWGRQMLMVKVRMESAK